MDILKIYGYGDRFIYTSGIEGCYPEINVTSIETAGPPGSNACYSGTMHVVTNQDVTILSVHALYSGSGGNWSFAVAPEDEYSTEFIKNITRTIAPDDEFSEMLLIKVPKKSKLIFHGAYWKGKEE